MILNTALIIVILWGIFEIAKTEKQERFYRKLGVTEWEYNMLEEIAHKYEFPVGTVISVYLRLEKDEESTIDLFEQAKLTMG